jgi:hypothetical protein
VLKGEPSTKCETGLSQMSLLRIVDDAARRLHHPAGSAGSAVCLATPAREARLNVRHTVKPGVTGWAAVNGWRGNTDLAERIRFDLDYIERWSLLFDFYIMLLTFSRNKTAY